MSFWKPGRYLRQADRARDQRKWEQASDYYVRYLRRRPQHAAIWVQLGHMYKESGQFSSAADAYDRAASLMPDDADVQLSIGHLNKLTGNRRAAAAAYRRALGLDPSLQDARHELGLNEADLGAPDEIDGESAVQQQLQQLRSRVLQLEKALATLLADRTAKGEGSEC